VNVADDLAAELVERGRSPREVAELLGSSDGLVAPMRVGVPSLVADLAREHGIDLAPDGPRRWPCVGQMDGVCPSGAMLPERRGYCPECAAVVARAMRVLAMKGARAALPPDCPTFATLRALLGTEPRLRPEPIDALDAWRPGHSSVTVIGKSGTGKSGSAKALVRRLVEAAEERDRTPAEMEFFRGVRFVEGVELGKAGKRHKLGAGASPLEAMARRATLLVLDDFGKGATGDQQGVVDVIMARPRTAVNIITSELTRAQINERYGRAIYRRVVEDARVVEAF
jgi:DNA replication protein DnaC